MSAAPAARRASVLRRLALSGGVLLACALLAEGIARRGGYDARRARAEAGAILEAFEPLGAAPRGADEDEDEGEGGGFHPALHPYLGYESETGLRASERQVAEHLSERRSELFTVLVFGGSVAQHFCGPRYGAADVLRERLMESPLLAGRRARIHALARAGYKQPQQMHSLASFLASGAAPDVVINLDGYNELRLGSANPARGLPVAWPSASHWAHLAHGRSPPPEALDLLATMRGLERGARRVAVAGERLPLHSSALLGRLQVARLRAIRAEWARAQDRYAALLLESSAQGAAAGEAPSLEASLAAAVDVWAGASRVMHELCGARGALYLHGIQPTLHVPGAKPVTEEERAAGIGPGGLDREVVAGYALLRARAAELAALGVDVLDLTDLFADVEETLYFDRCHFRRPGHALLAERLAREILARLER